MKQGTVYLRYEGEILRLKVSYDTNKLKRIEKEMIEKCSIVTKVRDKREFFYEARDYDYSDSDHYKNVDIRVSSYPHRDEEREDITVQGERYVSYDYYDYPDFVVEIGNVTRGGIGGTRGFGLSFEEEVERKPITEEITEAMQTILNNKAISEKTRVDKLAELSSILNDITSGTVVYPTVHETSFNRRVLSTMSVEVEGRIDESVVADFTTFFANSISKTMNEEFKRKIIDFDSLDEILKAHIKPILAKQKSGGKKLKQLVPDNN